MAQFCQQTNNILRESYQCEIDIEIMNQPKDMRYKLSKYMSISNQLSYIRNIMNLKQFY